MLRTIITYEQLLMNFKDNHYEILRTNINIDAKKKHK